jgi:hypothetical protein
VVITEENILLFLAVVLPVITLAYLVWSIR